ncbi:MAG: hypothetical protein CMJ80_11140 [Planctomycetaceae bacterium]|nr:hypothetical protein [Planctomycetaceae bacterium]
MTIFVAVFGLKSVDIDPFARVYGFRVVGYNAGLSRVRSSRQGCRDESGNAPKHHDFVAA